MFLYIMVFMCYANADYGIWHNVDCSYAKPKASAPIAQDLLIKTCSFFSDIKKYIDKGTRIVI
ncbi:MAG TPA: hypothetical protein DCQ46_05055 [Lachnospiraceae bacterium]|nr:hypothetical protein [Lachnospiraceae bacterium]